MSSDIDIKTYKNRKSMNVMLSIVLFMLLVTSLLFSSLKTSSNALELYFLNVGQGDAILLRYNNYDLLVDGGPSNSINYFLGRLFYPFCSIDSVLLTHPHSDHLDGLNLILDRCRVGSVFHSNLDAESEGYKDFLKKISKHNNIKVQNLYKDNILKINDLNILVVWPTEEEVVDQQLNLNSLSLALLVDYGDFEALLLGDIERDAQDLINISDFSPYIQGKLDVLKFPHHGAQNALNRHFIDKIDPEVVVISVGKNSYGHPSSEVIDFLNERGTKVYRTDEQGTIKLKYVR